MSEQDALVERVCELAGLRTVTERQVAEQIIETVQGAGLEALLGGALAPVGRGVYITPFAGEGWAAFIQRGPLDQHVSGAQGATIIEAVRSAVKAALGEGADADV